MQIIENSIVKEKAYIEKLDNGMTIIVIPKKNIQKKYVIWGTNYGSIDNHFINPEDNKEIEVPDGIAHFLEHKLFEQENGTNSLDNLTKLGVNANAYTTNDYTAYLFEATSNFYEALDELMDYVQHPYFTDENVEKEKGIIEQEIMMYQDYPEWVVYLNAIKAMYKDNPIKIDITGTAESIAKIDKEILYKCYNTFYNPSNMTIVFSGDLDPENIIEEVKKRLINKKSYTDIKSIYKKEQEEIVKKEIKENMEVNIPIFVIAIKDKIENNMVKKQIAIEIILNILIGKSSNLYKKLYKENLLMSEPLLEYEFSKTYAHVAITSISKEPNKILEEIKKEINNLKKDGINEEEFNRIKNMIYGSYIKEYNNVSDISRMFLSDYFKGINSFEYIEEVKNIDIDYVKEVLERVFVEDKTVISIVETKK